MAIVKLSEAGQSVTWRIKSAEVVAGKFGSQVKFESEGGDILFISEETAGRQLARIPLDVDTCAGETLTFSRSENPKGGAPYWNITLADAVDRSQPAEPKRVESPYTRPTSTSQTQAVAPVASEKMRIANAYVDLFKFLKVQTGMQDEQALQAATATVWIAWNQQGLTRAEPPKAEAPKPAPKPKAEPDFSKFPPESTDSDLPF